MFLVALKCLQKVFHCILNGDIVFVLLPQDIKVQDQGKEQQHSATSLVMKRMHSNNLMLPSPPRASKQHVNVLDARAKKRFRNALGLLESVILDPGNENGGGSEASVLSTLDVLRMGTPLVTMHPVENQESWQRLQPTSSVAGLIQSIGGNERHTYCV